jgi:uncharacterized caspase-like protein
MVVSNKRRALVIGVSDYKSTSIPNLNLPAVNADIRNISKAFILQNINVDEPSLLNPTRSDILTRVREFCSSATSTDYLFLYFSGHGINYLNTNYLVPYDAYLDDPRYIAHYVVDVH